MSRSALGFVVLVLLARQGSLARVLCADDFQHVRPSSGYLAHDSFSLPPEAVLGGLAYLPDGRLATYESSSGEIVAHGSGPAAPLARFMPPVFGSFLAVAPGGGALLFGESTAGGVFSVPLAGGQAALVDRIAFNYDIAFDSQGRGYVSAPGLDGQNSVRLLDNDPEQESRVVLAGLEGFSGPVAIDGKDDLYYGTANSRLESGQRILKFRRDLVDLALTGQPLEEGDAEIFLDEQPGFFNMKFAGERLLFTDLGFATGTGTLFAVDPGQDLLVSPIATFHVPAGLAAPSYLDFRAGSRPFEVGAGEKGGAVAVAFSDFSTVNQVAQVIPELYFVRGRINDDGVVDLSDAVFILAFLFNGGESPSVGEAADVNGDGVLDLSDPIYLLDFLFRGGPVIPAPFPDPGPAV